MNWKFSGQLADESAGMELPVTHLGRSKSYQELQIQSTHPKVFHVPIFTQHKRTFLLNREFCRLDGYNSIRGKSSLPKEIQL